MNVEIGKLNTTIRTTDSDALMEPQVLEKLVPLLARRVKQELDRERDRSDGQLRPGVTTQERPNWA